MKKIKTAAYCRVSTRKEEQDGSYEIQERYFTDLISSNPDMEFAGIYGDKGKTGLYLRKRPGLQKLLEDSRKGEIDLILTKSISRFARNMAECAEMVRELRCAGVNIRFIVPFNEKEAFLIFPTGYAVGLIVITLRTGSSTNSPLQYNVLSSML